MCLNSLEPDIFWNSFFKKKFFWSNKWVYYVTYFPRGLGEHFAIKHSNPLDMDLGMLTTSRKNKDYKGPLARLLPVVNATR